MRKHLGKLSNRILRLKKTCCQLVIQLLVLLLSGTTLNLVLNQSLAKSSTDCANHSYIWHYQAEICHENKMPFLRNSLR